MRVSITIEAELTVNIDPPEGATEQEIKDLACKHFNANAYQWTFASCDCYSSITEVSL